MWGKISSEEEEYSSTLVKTLGSLLVFEAELLAVPKPCGLMEKTLEKRNGK